MFQKAKRRPREEAKKNVVFASAELGKRNHYASSQSSLSRYLPVGPMLSGVLRGLYLWLAFLLNRYWKRSKKAINWIANMYFEAYTYLLWSSDGG